MMAWSLFDREWSPFDADELFRRVWSFPAPSRRLPHVNVWQGEDDVLVTSEIPGVEAGNLDVSVENDTIRISGKRGSTEHDEGEKLHRRERGTGAFSRTVTLPYRLDPASVEASYNRGVLRVHAARAAEDRPRRIAVKSK